MGDFNINLLNSDNDKSVSNFRFLLIATPSYLPKNLASVLICQRFRFVGEGSVSKVAPSTKEVNLGDVTSRCFQESSF